MPVFPQNVVLNPAEETIVAGQLNIRFLVTAENSAGSIAAFELAVPGRERLMAPAHSHDLYEESIYGVEGVMTWTVEGTAMDLAPGQMLCIPRGAVHRFDNNTGMPARALCVITPAAIGPQYFREIAAVFDEAAGGPPDRARIAEIMLRHGLRPSPPALPTPA